ncbi:RHS repeat-associated core domain-containing protein [Streptomyces diacarni]|uniref:RHS repeat-associated core domain-containing protein n=1 Tax=Streptomyces diacarni TaxID=2800381 RepID=UPI003404FC08
MTRWAAASPNRARPARRSPSPGTTPRTPTARSLKQTTPPLTPEPGTSLLTKLTDPTATRPRFQIVLTDLTGTPTELATPDGEVTWRHRTTLWGTPLPSPTPSATTTCPLRFPGQYADDETELHYNCIRYYDPETGRYLSPDPLGLAAGANPMAYVVNPHTGCDPLGLYDCEKVNKVIDKAVERAAGGRRRTAGKYHGHLTPEKELEILSQPDGVYISQGGAERLIFHKGEDIVVMESSGAKGGNVITSYGPSGPKNESGAAAWGGSATDPGPPVTRKQLIEGGIPTPKGGTLPPATPLR